MIFNTGDNDDIELTVHDDNENLLYVDMGEGSNGIFSVTRERAEDLAKLLLKFSVTGIMPEE